MSLASLKMTIASRLEAGQLQEAYDLSKSVDLYDLSEDIAELIYSRDEDYQDLLKSIVNGLKGLPYEK